MTGRVRSRGEGVIRPRARPSSTRSSKTRWSRAEARRPASSTRPEPHSRAARRGVPQVPGEQGPRRARVPASGAGGVTGGERLGGGPAGGDPGGHGVEDALAGHRVHQPGGVAHQEHPAGRRAPPRAREGQVVTDPAGATVGGTGQQLLEPLEQLGAGGRLAIAVEHLAVADVGEAVAPVERPRVRRLPRGAEHDQLGPAVLARCGRVAAQRQRRTAVASPERAPDHRVGAVGADDDARGRRARPRPRGPVDAPASRPPPARPRPGVRRARDGAPPTPVGPSRGRRCVRRGSGAAG